LENSEQLQSRQFRRVNVNGKTVFFVGTQVLRFRAHPLWLEWFHPDCFPKITLPLIFNAVA
jgi:hypothetical protein